MQKAILERSAVPAASLPDPSRRHALAALTVAAAGALALTMPTSAPAAIPQAGADAELLGLLAELEAIHRRINGMWAAGWKVAPGPNHIEDDDEREAATEPLNAEAATLLDRITKLRAATPEAWKAKARCLLLMDLEYRQYCHGEGDPCSHEQLLGSLLHDMTGGTITELDIADTPLVALSREDQEPQVQLVEMTEVERAMLDAEDPFRARLGSPPFREQFPLWTLSPATLNEWLETAEREFLPLSICESMQRHSAAKLEASWREYPEGANDILHALIGLSSRYAKMANALHGEAIRLGIARIRARGDEPSDGLLAAMAMGQLIEDDGREHG